MPDKQGCWKLGCPQRRAGNDSRNKVWFLHPFGVSGVRPIHQGLHHLDDPSFDHGVIARREIAFAGRDNAENPAIPHRKFKACQIRIGYLELGKNPCPEFANLVELRVEGTVHLVPIFLRIQNGHFGPESIELIWLDRPAPQVDHAAGKRLRGKISAFFQLPLEVTKVANRHFIQSVDSNSEEINAHRRVVHRAADR